MNTFIIGLLAFMLMLFPNSGGLQYQYQMRTFDTVTTLNSIMDAIETRDVNALEAMMCRNIKRNVGDLPGKIGELIDAVDGKITGWDWWPNSGYDGAKSGKKIMQKGWTIQLETVNGSYFLVVRWEIANNFAPEEIGMRAIALFDKDNKLLADIKATEGVGGWLYFFSLLVY